MEVYFGEGITVFQHKLIEIYMKCVPKYEITLK